MTMNPRNPFGGHTPLIENQLGADYAHVREVAHNVNVIRAVDANKANIDKAAQISDDVLTLKEQMVEAVETSSQNAEEAKNSSIVATDKAGETVTAAQEAGVARNEAVQAASNANALVGSVAKAVLGFSTYSEAQSALPALLNGQLVDVESEQKRYRVTAGALVFEKNLLRRDLSDTSQGTNLISLLPPGLGAVARTLLQELNVRSGVRLLDFSDLTTRVPGETDDSPAAVKALNLIKLRGAGSLILPDGDVRFNSSVTIKMSDVVVVGGANTRVLNGTTDAPAIDFGDQGQMYFRCGIRNVIFSQVAGVNATEGNCGYRARNQGSFTEKNVTVYEYPARLYRGIVWLRVVAGAYAMRAVQGCANDGSYFGEICNDIYFDTFRSDANGGTGVVWRDTQGVFGSNATAYGNHLFGWDIGTAGGNDCKNFFMVNVCGDTNGSDNWHISQLLTGEFFNAWGSTQKDTGNYLTACGFFIDGPQVKNLSFIGGQALFNNGHGVYVNQADNLEFVGFKGGIDGNGNGQSGLASGLYVGDNARDVRTIGGSYRSNSDQGIRIVPGALNTQILGSSLRNNAIGPIYNQSDSSVIRSCPGYNPQMGAVTSPVIPASGVSVKNITGSDVTVYISDGTITAIFIDGSYVSNQGPATIRLPAGASISMNYSSAPVWKWMGE